MITSFLAQFWGIIFVIAGSSFLIRQENTRALLKLAQNEGMMVLTGYLALIMGVGHILIYNNWTAHWTVILTITGWIIFAKGFIGLVAPGFTQGLIKMYTKPKNLRLHLIVMIILGLYLVKKGFGL